MGNLESGNPQNSPQGLADFTQIRRQNNGVVLNDKKSDCTYFLKEFNYVSKKQYENEFKRLQSLESQPQNQNVLPLVRLFSQTFNNICSTSFKIYALYEYPSITLQQQISARKKQNKFFQECQLWSILQSCANALSQLKPSLSLHPKNIFIVPDGVLKVINNEMIDQDYRCYVKDYVYYAPQKISQFKKCDNDDLLRKQSIFSLGMTLLNAALLHPVNDCYNYQNCQFNKQMLQKHIEQLVNMKSTNINEQKTNEITRMYSQDFIQTLAMILQPYPNKRVSLMQVHGLLNKIWNTQTQQNGNPQDPEQNNNQQQQINQNQNQQQQHSAIKQLQQKNINLAHLDSIKQSGIKNNQTIQQSQVTKNQNYSQNPSFFPSYHQSQRQSKANLHQLTSNNIKTSTLNTSIQNMNTSIQNVSLPYNHNYYPPTTTSIYPSTTSYLPEYRQPYIPSVSSSTANLTSGLNFNKQNNNNLYTDPKLLQMIRKDLRDLNQLKKSSIMSSYAGFTTSYVPTSNHYYSGYNDSQIGGLLSSKSSLGMINNTMNMNYQVYTANTEMTGALSQRNQNITQIPIHNKQQNTIISSKVIQQRHYSQTTIVPKQNKTQVQSQPQSQPQKFAKNNVVFVVEQYDDGRKFQGAMINGIKEGRGKLTYSDGAYYEGDFKNDKMQGQGTLFYGPDRPAYQGSWMADQFHGFGILYNENPLQLNGCFNYNDFNLIEDFWVRYQGNFDSDNKCGQGKLILSNEEEFHGEFSNDFINGKGVFFTQDGEEVSGIWEDNILVQLDA